MTGQDFGRDPEAWSAWVKAHRMGPYRSKDG
jgi:hypothetical protein